MLTCALVFAEKAIEFRQGSRIDIGLAKTHRIEPGNTPNRPEGSEDLSFSKRPSFQKA